MGKRGKWLLSWLKSIGMDPELPKELSCSSPGLPAVFVFMSVVFYIPPSLFSFPTFFCFPLLSFLTWFTNVSLNLPLRAMMLWETVYPRIWRLGYEGKKSMMNILGR